MAKRGRPRKSEELTIATPVDHAKLLKQFEQEQRVQLETLYKDLAVIRKKVDLALTKIGFIDEAESLSQAAFKAGRAYGPLDEANDKLEEMLDGIYDNNDFDHYDDIFEN
jgi:hypothetical protein